MIVIRMDLYKKELWTCNSLQREQTVSFYNMHLYPAYMFLDLTIPLDANTPVFPGSPKPQIHQFATIEKDGYNEKKLTFTSHISTHIDAPRHMLSSGKTLTEYPINKFIGDGIVIDVRGQKEIEVDETDIHEEDIVFFFTGHSKKFYESDYFKNNPVLTEKTAQKLIDKKIKIMGIDSFTPDNKPYPVHNMLLQNDILIVENLIHLDKLLQKRFTCYILPLKIQDADGAPCRIVAEIH